MPSIGDWRTCPYNVIQQLFDENKDNAHEAFITQVEDYFSQRLCPETINTIPSLNDTKVEELTPGSLVRYRCMVQDVFDPQLTFGRYVVTNEKTHKTRLECGSFKDTPALLPFESIDEENADNKPVERLGFFCVPIPGEQDWVKELYRKQQVQTAAPSSSDDSKLKRKQRDDDDDDNTAEVSPTGHKCKLHQSLSKLSSDNPEETVEMAEQRNSPADTNQQRLANETLDNVINFPLPHETGTACIVRVYSNKVELKTTDAIEVVGILTVDPILASIGDDLIDDLIDKEDILAHEPPPSLVPRVHALNVRMLDHNNPYLPSIVSSNLYKTNVKELLQDANTLRLELHSILQHALLGDALAAEYLLCSLISHVYARVDSMALGKFCVNLSGCPVTQKYSTLLNYLISQLTTSSTFMEMSIANMNSWKLIPKKDFKANRISAGMLQLTSGTQIVLDETALEQGQLENAGVLNVKALEDVISWQKVDYDFQWSAITIPCDFNVLILSECTSLLSKDFHVPLTKVEVADIPSHFTLLDSRLTDQMLGKLRSYITVCKQLTYEVPDDIQKALENDFVETRQISPSEMSIDDFQRLLTLLRFLTTSYGLEHPNLELWAKAKALEDERKTRVAILPKSSSQRTV